MKKGFTLLELIIVIVVIGILATLGYTQYSRMVESTRSAEAKTILGTCIKTAYEYYIKNGDISSITDTDLNIGNSPNQIPAACTSTGYFYYYQLVASGKVGIRARRCISGGKNPQASQEYIYRVDVEPASGLLEYYCWSDNTWYGPFTNWGQCAKP